MTRVRSGLRQRGAALLAMVAIVVLASSYLLVSHLNAASSLTTINREHNAKVLAQAKQALIGYIAHQAAMSGENNPGRLPCPEPSEWTGIAGAEGIAAPGTQAGIPANTCISIGRLPWRTLGLDKLVDAASEPLWYVVGPAWRLTTSTSTLTINPATAGDTTVDLQQVVALIIAPGPAMSVQAAANCTARNQARAAPAPSRNALDYLECYNAGTLQFFTTAASTSYNDQVLRVTVADVMPAIEAAVAARVEREIVPPLSSAYLGPSWGLAAGDRVFPYAAPFTNPTTSNYSGTLATLQGLMPVVSTSCLGGTPLPCNASFVGWRNWATSIPIFSYTGVGVTLLPTCDYMSATSWGWCEGTYVGGTAQITLRGTQDNAAMALRQINSAAVGFVMWQDLLTFSFNWTTVTPSVVMNSDGSITVTVTGTIPAPLSLLFGGYFWIYVPGNSTTDHALLNHTTTGVGATGWFVRNRWHRYMYYATASGYTAAGVAPRSCSDSGLITCVQVTNLTDPTKQRAVLALAGRALRGQTQPNAGLQHYLDTAENYDGIDLLFEQAKVGSSFNDRFISVSKNP